MLVWMKALCTCGHFCSCQHGPQVGFYLEVAGDSGWVWEMAPTCIPTAGWDFYPKRQFQGLTLRSGDGFAFLGLQGSHHSWWRSEQGPTNFNLDRGERTLDSLQITCTCVLLLRIANLRPSSERCHLNCGSLVI